MLQQLSVVAMLSLWARKALGIGCQKRAWLKASNLVFLRSQASHLWHVTYQQYFIKSCHKLVTSFILPDAPKRFSTAAWKPVTLSRKKVWQVLSVLFVRQPHVLSIFLLICSFPPSAQLSSSMFFDVFPWRELGQQTCEEVHWVMVKDKNLMDQEIFFFFINIIINAISICFLLMFLPHKHNGS